MTCSVSRIEMRLAANTYLPHVKKRANNAYPAGSPSVASRRAANCWPPEPGNVIGTACITTMIRLLLHANAHELGRRAPPRIRTPKLSLRRVEPLLPGCQALPVGEL